MKPIQRFSRWLFYLAILPAALGVAGWQGWSWWSWASAPVVATTPEMADKVPAVQIKIPSGTPAQQIGQDLAAAGIIRSAEAWDVWTRWLTLQSKVLPTTQGPNFQAGTYELSPAQPLQAIADQILQGDVVQRRFTVPEGWSLRQMAAYFESQDWFTAEEFLQAASQIDRSAYPWLPPNLPYLEGFLYPDTYELANENPTADEIVRLMLDRFAQVALPLYEEARGQTEFSLLEWVTLGSIVEKEAVIPTERGTIAGVFVQRLKQDIPLGADPTVEYGLNVQQTPDQPLTLAQVNTPTPYNTYINAGLPPTPIASPGQASLEAVLQPESTEYLYFVARYDGTHVFSRTLEEHEAAQATIRDQQDALRSPAPPSPEPAATPASPATAEPAVSPSPSASPTP